MYKTESRLSVITLTPVKVYTLLKTLDIAKANGPDEISNTMLKQTAEVIAEPLSRLFNKSMGCSVFPDIWKQANVTPIFKKNDKQK